MLQRFSDKSALHPVAHVAVSADFHLYACMHVGKKGHFLVALPLMANMTIDFFGTCKVTRQCDAYLPNVGNHHL